MKTSKVFGIARSDGTRLEEDMFTIVPVKLHCFKSKKEAEEFASEFSGHSICEIEIFLYDNLAEALV